MAAAQCIERLGAWEGYELEGAQEEHRGGVLWSILKLHPQSSGARRCSGCGFCGAPVHDQEERRVRDLPVFEAPRYYCLPPANLQPAASLSESLPMSSDVAHRAAGCCAAGMSVDGRSITVNLARPREEGRGPGRSGADGFKATNRADVGYGNGGYGGGRY